MTKKSNQPNIVNRRARFDYELGEEIVVGIELTGPEVRAVRDHHAQLKGAFVTIKDNELWLNNASFSLKNHQPNSQEAHTVDTRQRKLLAHRKQIDNLASAKTAGMTILPIKLLTTGRLIKLVIATGKGKKKYDKRQTLKRRDDERSSRRAVKRF